jgi:hypothetical protein
MLVPAGFLEFKLNFSGTKDLPIGHVIKSEVFSAGGHLWCVYCYPRGAKKAHDGEYVYVSIYLMLASKSENVEAFFEVFLLTIEGSPSIKSWRCWHVFQPNMPWGFPRFVKRSQLGLSMFLSNGKARFMCGVIVVPGYYPTAMLPPPDIGSISEAYWIPLLGRMCHSLWMARPFLLIGLCLQLARRSSKQSSLAQWQMPQCQLSRCKTLSLKHLKLCSGSCTLINFLQTKSLGTLPLICCSIYLRRLTGTPWTG